MDHFWTSSVAKSIAGAPFWVRSDMSPLARPKVGPEGVQRWSIMVRNMDSYWSYSPLCL